MESSRERIVRLLGPWPFPSTAIVSHRENHPSPAAPAEIQEAVFAVPAVPPLRKRKKVEWHAPVFTVEKTRVIVRGSKDDFIFLDHAEFLRLVAYAHEPSVESDRRNAIPQPRGEELTRFELPPVRRFAYNVLQLGSWGPESAF